MAVKQYNGLWLPEHENYLQRDIDVSPVFAGNATIQFKKFARAVPEFRQFRHAIDIGANLGIWTRVIAVCFNRVSCFEPNPECHEAFRLNNEAALREGRIQLYPVALGAEEATVKMQTKLSSTGFVRVDPNGNITVEQKTLDSFGFDEVDFIKIDVEGWEHNVIKGAVETIKRNRPVMIVEQKPNNAEMHGMKQFGATNLLKKLGMREVANISGDIVLSW